MNTIFILLYWIALLTYGFVFQYWMMLFLNRYAPGSYHTSISSCLWLAYFFSIVDISGFRPNPLFALDLANKARAPVAALCQELWG